MSYKVDYNPSGLFVLSTEVGRPLFDGAFRGDIPESLRLKTLDMLAEAPSMLILLRTVAEELEEVRLALAAGRDLDLFRLGSLAKEVGARIAQAESAQKPLDMLKAAP